MKQNLLSECCEMKLRLRPNILCLLTCTFTLISVSRSFKFYQNSIPNGGHVTNPCDSSVWDGVGHNNKEGGGERNVFGKAFERAGKWWTRDLCRADSDGDGRTNGEELGDPQCIWVPDHVPTITRNITHPGVCEPLDDPHCKDINKDIKCPVKWSCPATGQPDVSKLRINISRRKVPAKRTTYICYNKQVPSDRLYDVVASKSIIDNANVMHHMTMYGCTGELHDDMDGSVDNCELQHRYCHKMLHIWAVGMVDYCAADDRAVRFGKDLTTWVSVQYHWNNPEQASDYTDSSGVELYYSSNLRKYAVDMFQTGDNGIFIPPNSKDFKVRGLCSHECSIQSFERTVNITAVILHMHGAGRRMWAKHYRNGQLLGVLAEDNSFNSNKPVVHRYEEHPIVFEPGDELEVECTFDTEGNNEWVINGPGSNNEMCVTLISYYPANVFKVDNCYSVKGRCARSIEQIAPGCDLAALRKLVVNYQLEILQFCDTFTGKTCSKQCNNFIGGIRYAHKNCFDNQPEEVSRFIWASVITSQLNEEFGEKVRKSFQACDLYQRRHYFLPVM